MGYHMQYFSPEHETWVHTYLYIQRNTDYTTDQETFSYDIITALNNPPLV